MEITKKKRVLGRGLGALIEDMGRDSGTPERKYMLCRVEDISANRLQPRRGFNEEALTELADSIKEKGIIEPLIVRKNVRDNTGGYELVAGERRLRAARMAALKEVPVLVVDVSDEESLELAMIENIQRSDLNAMEEAEAYHRLMGFGLTQDSTAKRVGKPRATVANFLRLLALPSEVKQELRSSAITMGHAKAILSLQGHAAQRELCKRIVKKGLSVREAEAEAAKGVSRTVRSVATQQHATPLEEELQGVFGTKVSVKDKNGRGRVEISFFSTQERERIIGLLRSVER